MKYFLRHLPSKGFTLVEMSIVLVIVAALIGGMTVPLSAQIEQRNRAETRRQLDEIRESLIGFAIVHERLPRPATSSSDGTENPNNCGNDAACTGFIPWATLGVKKTDAWNKMIRYSVTPAYADAAFALTTPGSKKVRTRDDSGTPIYLIGANGSCSSSPCAPAVVFSFGKNNWGTTPEGAAVTDDSTTNSDEDTNASETTLFFARDLSNVPIGGEFDDILVWIPPYLLFNRMIAAGRLP
ncbi:MAG: type II secretion system GspH family protein [Candidatus Accumulibacter sp.]|jgi:prepilin-type N-terminal cleavage/methylation domain-containing protein|nr:type II secretion system GspH family protein [Accumulibacter sp.]